MYIYCHHRIYAQKYTYIYAFIYIQLNIGLLSALIWFHIFCVGDNLFSPIGFWTQVWLMSITSPYSGKAQKVTARSKN